MRRYAMVVLVAAMAVAGGMGGCSTVKNMTSGKATPEIVRLRITPRRLHPAESGLAMADVRNAPSTDYHLMFSATLGTVKPSPDGTSATFTAGADAGNAVVTAHLMSRDGAVVSTAEVKVLILPLR